MPRRSLNVDASLDEFEYFEVHFDEFERVARISPERVDPPRARFNRYSETEWQAIEAEAKGLPDFDACEKWVGADGQVAHSLRYELETVGSNFLYLSSARPPLSLSERMRRWIRVWQGIEELEDAILAASEAHFGGAPVPNGALEELDRQLECLHNFKFTVATNASGLREHVFANSIARPRSARIELFHAVLRVWQALGGELSLPSDGLSGSLARFFFAAVGPVMGAEQPSRSSLRDIVTAYEAWLHDMAENSAAFMAGFCEELAAKAVRKPE